MLSTISPDTAFVNSSCPSPSQKSSTTLTLKLALVRIAATAPPVAGKVSSGWPQTRTHPPGCVWAGHHTTAGTTADCTAMRLDEFDMFDAVLQDAHGGVVAAQRR
jgi:hypothetical protein